MNKTIEYLLQHFNKIFYISIIGFCIWFLPNIYILRDKLSFGNYIQLWDHFNLYVGLLVFAGIIYASIKNLNFVHVLTGTTLGQIIFLIIYASQTIFTGLSYIFCALYTSFTFLAFQFIRLISHWLKETKTC